MTARRPPLDPARLRVIVIVTVSALTGLLLGWWMPLRPLESAPKAHPRPPIERFRAALDVITQHHVDSPTHDDLIPAALQALVGTLDRHSQLFDPDAYRRWRARIHGRRTGPGFEVAPRDGRFFISEVAPGSPAATLGMTPGDEILTIDGSPLTGLSSAAALKLLEGDEGTPVTVQWRHDPHDDLAHPTRTVTLLRANQRTVAVRAARLPGGLLHVRVERFQEGVARDVLEQCRRFEAEAPLLGIILDLRGNLGGLLNESVLMADMFLPPGRLIVSLRGRAGALIKSHAAAADVLLPHPLVVLIDHRSASASEIVAGALQDHGRALIVGRVSYGKGSVQSTYPLKDGGGLKITTSRYFTPSLRKIDDVGVAPDIPVPPQAASARRPKAPAPTPNLDLSDDPPLEAAANLLRAHHIFSARSLPHPPTHLDHPTMTSHESD